MVVSQRHTLSWPRLLVMMASASAPWSEAFTAIKTTPRPSSALFYGEKDSTAQDALERTAAHLEKLKRMRRTTQPDLAGGDSDEGWSEEGERLKQNYLLQSANSLKEELKRRKLPRTGRKPDLARRLAEDDLKIEISQAEPTKDAEDAIKTEWIETVMAGADAEEHLVLSSFAGLRLSEAAGSALGKAGFTKPTPIQAASIPPLSEGESLVLHAETGSGKSLAYLLPITEKFWGRTSNQQEHRALILTPTRELAAQVAGIASVLAPPGTVRLVAKPTNLMSDGMKDRGEGEFGGRVMGNGKPMIFVGSAKAVMHSLYGDGKMPASPTPKPEAMAFLQSVRWLAMDEVDRLLNVKKAKSDKINNKKHEKAAAILAAAIERTTLGQAQIIAASATVGRPLRRELARVLGLPAQECPPIVRGTEETVEEASIQIEKQHTRAVTLPETVENYILSVNGNSEGKLLTGAYKLIQELGKKPRRMLLVLSRGFGMNTQNAIGALKHFKLTPEPLSLLDVLEADGTDAIIETHRQVSGSSGVGESRYFSSDNNPVKEQQYLFVTGEDTVRGLHLDGLEVVIVVGRANSPDEYTHIAGRTGRAGRSGKVINVVLEESGASLKSWEKMLNCPFTSIDLEDAANL